MSNSKVSHILILLLYSICYVYGQGLNWISQVDLNSIGHKEGDKIYYTANTSEDNFLYSAGYIESINGERKIIISKYEQNEPKPVWSKTPKFPNNGKIAFVYDIAISKRSDQLTLAVTTDKEPFLIHLNSLTGDVASLKSIDCENCNIIAIEYSPDNALSNKQYIGGRFSGSITFRGSQTYTATEGDKSDIFIARYAETGVFEDAIILKSAFEDLIFDLAIDDQNIISTIIYTEGKTYTNDTPLELDTYNEKRSYKLVKIDTELEVSFFQQISSVHYDSVYRDIRDDYKSPGSLCLFVRLT